MFKIYSIILIILLIFSTSYAGEVYDYLTYWYYSGEELTVAWDANTEENIKEYRLRIWSKERQRDVLKTVIPHPTTQITLLVPRTGHLEFFLRACDTDDFCSVETVATIDGVPKPWWVYGELAPVVIEEEFIDIWLEAEQGVLQDPMAIITDPSAYSGEYISSTSDTLGSALYTFDISNDPGEYVVWLRAKGLTEGTNSFFITIDDREKKVFHIPVNEEWTWIKSPIFNDTKADLDWMVGTVNWSVGEHSITIFSREKDSQLDKIFVTNNLEINETYFIETMPSYYHMQTENFKKKNIGYPFDC